jgi:predicted amidohydrolase YtcJ
MSKSTSRREFLGLTAAGTVGLVGSSFWTRAWAAAETPDLVVYNAKVHTVDRSVPRAEAFAVRDGRFLAVGKSTEIRGLIGKGTQAFDAQGMMVVPGFNDSHNHIVGTDVLYSVHVGNPFVAEYVSIASIIDKLRAKARQTPPDTWVVGTFFDDTKVTDGRQLNIHDLDEASTDLPIVVHHRGGHTAFYNSKAFQIAGITKDTPNPFGGTFDKDGKGELNGRVTDRANDAFAKVGRRQTFAAAEVRKGLAYMSRKFVEYGVTSVCHEGGDLMALQQVRAQGELLHRVSYEAAGEVLEAMLESGIESGFGDEWIRFGATSEHVVDGSFSERTMSLSMGYPGVSPPYHGNITTTQSDLDAWVERVHRAGIRPNCHANGDTAIEMTLTAYERALGKYPRRDVRPKVTHCTLVNDDIIRRMKAMDAVPAVFSTYPYYNADKFHFYGEAVLEHCMAFRSFQKAGIRAADGSDFPPGPFDPRMAIQGQVTRTGFNGESWGANQRISVAEAIEVGTLNGAYNTHEENIKGSITPGKLADYVVLAEDLHTVAPSKIKDVQVVRTVVGGNTVYRA